MEQSIKIFIPLGTQLFQFNRLVKAINNLIIEQIFQPQEILIQSSIIDIKPICKYVNYLSSDDFNRYIEEAELIITHAGVNSIMTCMRKKKPLIIAPRQKQFHEHVDNHQLEIADLMEQKFNVIVVKDMKNLPSAINKARNHKYKDWVSKHNEFILSLKEIILSI